MFWCVQSASNGLPTPLRINSQVAEVLLDYLYEDDLKVSGQFDMPPNLWEVLF